MVVVLLLAGAALVAQVPGDRERERAEVQRLSERLKELENQLEQLRRFVPPSFDPGETESWLRKVSGRAELENVQIRVEPGSRPLPLGDGQPSSIEVHAIEVSGLAEYQAIERFLRPMSMGLRGARIDTLRLKAAPGTDATTPNPQPETEFTARLLFPSFAGEPEPAAPDRRSYVAILQERARRHEATIAALLGFFDAARRQLFDALAIVGQAVEEQPVAFTEVRLDQELMLEGFLVGTAARSALLSGIEKARLTASRKDFSKGRPCQAFTISAEIQDVERPIEVLVQNGPFDHRTDIVCGVKAEPAKGRIEVRGAATPANERGMALRLREVDVVDVFSALNDLIAEDFIVDDDVRGRVTLEVLEGATVDETLDAIASGSGVTIGAGPLRRVSRSRSAAAEGPGGTTGEPVTFQVKRADTADVLCLFGEISGLTIKVPPDLRGQVNIFATEIAWTDLLAGLTSSLGLVSSFDANELILRRSSDASGGAKRAVNVCETRNLAFPSRLSRMPLSPAQLGVADLELAGMARIGAEWRAYVYGPFRRLLPLEVNSRLLDATVTAVGPTEITLTTNSRQTIKLSL